MFRAPANNGKRFEPDKGAPVDNFLNPFRRRLRAEYSAPQLHIVDEIAVGVANL
jgi:hypothetical protein